MSMLERNSCTPCCSRAKVFFHASRYSLQVSPSAIPTNMPTTPRNSLVTHEDRFPDSILQDLPASWPCFFRHARIPASSSEFVTPSRTKCICTPSFSTSRLRLSSSKNSISSYLNPVAFCSLVKCVILLPG